MRARFVAALIRGAALVVVAALVAGCGSAARSRSGTSRAGLPQTVHVSGYSLTVRCTGSARTARPTIVLLSGVTQPLTTFTFIQNRLSSEARVCSYDRPGEGTSSNPQTEQTLTDSVTILHQVLARLDVASHGVVLVGHSLGGLIAAQYAAQYRTTHQVRALVLLDATPPDLGTRVLRLIPRQARGPAGQFRSWIVSFRSGEDQERLLLEGASVRGIGKVPLIVVRHGRPIFAGLAGYGRRLEQLWWEGQRAWLRLSPLSQMVVARRSGHPIYLDQPFLTLRVIRKALSEAS